MNKRRNKQGEQNERKIVQRFIPLQPERQLQQAHVVSEHKMKVTLPKGTTSGPKYEPVYDEGGNLIGHNEFMTDLEGEEIEAVLLVLDNGSTFWL